jgi:ribose transport system substrate-binding protein
MCSFFLATRAKSNTLREYKGQAGASAAWDGPLQTLRDPPMKRLTILCEVFAFAIICAVALALAGCSPQKSAEFRIGVVPKGLTHEFWQSIHRGADRAAADLEKEDGITVEVIWDGPSKESDAQEQIDIVRKLRNMGINGLVLAPQDSKAMVPAVEQCVANKIPVVVIDSGLDEDVLKKQPDLIVKYVATNNYNGGWLAAEELVKVLEKDGKIEPRVILFRYQPGSESTDQRERGFLDRIKKFNDEGKTIKVISDDKYAGATVETAEKEAGPLLSQFRDSGIDGIFAVNESAATGMLNALRRQKLTKKIHLVGFDSSEPLLQAVREGDIDGLIVQDPYRMGYLGVWTLVKSMKGYAVNANHEQLGTGEVYLTKDNIDDAEIKGRFSPEFQAKRTLQRPDFPKKQ